MLILPKKGIVRTEHNLGAVGTLTPGTSVTTGASASVKGTPAQIFAATLFDAYKIKVYAWNYGSSGAASQGAMDLLIGAATESILIANMLMGYCGAFGQATNAGYKEWEFPMYVPAGSRIAVQAAGIRLSTAFLVGLILIGGDGMPPHKIGTKCTTYGMGTVPNGTTITPGASGAEGSWAEIAAATNEDHFAFVPSFQISGDTSVLARGINVDIGIGAATVAEIAGGYSFHTDSGEVCNGPYGPGPAFVDVPAGTRLAMRASNSGTNDAYNGVIHAMS